MANAYFLGYYGSKVTLSHDVSSNYFEGDVSISWKTQQRSIPGAFLHATALGFIYGGSIASAYFGSLALLGAVTVPEDG